MCSVDRQLPQCAHKVLLGEPPPEQGAQDHRVLEALGIRVRAGALGEQLGHGLLAVQIWIHACPLTQQCRRCVALGA